MDWTLNNFPDSGHTRLSPVGYTSHLVFTPTLSNFLAEHSQDPRDSTHSIQSDLTGDQRVKRCQMSSGKLVRKAICANTRKASDGRVPNQGRRDRESGVQHVVRQAFQGADALVGALETLRRSG